MMDINCVGKLCQGLEMYAGGKMSTKCPCYVITKCESDATTTFQLQLTTDDGRVMLAVNFMSKKFTTFSMKKKSYTYLCDRISFLWVARETRSEKVDGKHAEIC